MAALMSSERDRAVLRSFARRIDRGDAGAHNNLGVLYFNKGMTEEAVAEFTRALELDPRMTVAQRNLEIAYFTSGYYDTRVQELRARLHDRPDDTEAGWELGRTYALLGDLGQAVDAFAALLRADSTDVRAMLQLALAEAKGGHAELAARWLQHALAITPGDASLHFHAGETAYHRGLNDEALVHLTEAVRLAPEDADAHYLLGFVLGDVGRHEEARAATERALQLNHALGRAHPNLSLERFDARSYDRAREARSARGLADPLQIAEEGSLAHFNLGFAFRQKGYLTEALREYRLALEHGEEPGLVQQAMAEVYLLQRNAAAAVELYDRLVQGGSSSPKLWNERGVALHQDGRLAEATASYERAVSCDPDYVLALNNLGVARAHAGDNASAQAALQHAVQLRPEFAKGRLNLALLHVRDGALAEALSAYEAALRIAPDHPVALNGLGLVLVQLHRFSDARTAYSRAIEARSGYAEAHYNLGFVLASLGDVAGSLRETKRALELDPFYTPQRFELAVDLEYEDPRFEISADLAGEVREAAVDDFRFEPRALDALFGSSTLDEHGAASPERPASPLEGLGEAHASRPVHVQDLVEAAARGEGEWAIAEVRRRVVATPREEALVALGTVFLAVGAAGEALERFREARALAPSRTDALTGELRALVSLRRFGEGRDAAASIERCAHPDVESLLLAGTVWAELGEEPRARAALEAACQLAPSSARTWQGVGDLTRLMGDDVAAIEAYGRAVSLDGDYAAARVQRANLLRRHGRTAEAEGELRAALAAVPTFADAILALAALHRELGCVADTIGRLAEYLSWNPYHLEALASLGESLFLGGRRGDARYAFDRVMRFDPEHAVALYFDGVFRAEARDYAGALAQWERVVALEPAGDAARRARRDARIAREALAGGLDSGPTAQGR